MGCSLRLACSHQVTLNKSAKSLNRNDSNGRVKWMLVLKSYEAGPPTVTEGRLGGPDFDLSKEQRVGFYALACREMHRWAGAGWCAGWSLPAAFRDGRGSALEQLTLSRAGTTRCLPRRLWAWFDACCTKLGCLLLVVTKSCRL